MKSALLSKAITLLSILLLAATVQAQTSDATKSASGNSKVRIVRLSQVKGAVDIDRHIGRGFEPAIANLPVVEQSKIRTGVGVAEVEFEDNSSLRLAPDSFVEFPSLERSASGATISTIHLIKGTAYISLVKPQDKKAPVNQFSLMFGERKLNLDPATHVRLELKGSEAKLAVMDGEVHVEGESGMVSIPKKKTATFQIFDQNEPTVAKDIETTPYDGWDHTAASYHSNAAAMSAFNSPYSYGLNDMMYYGSFLNGGDCGMMWRPYFASAAWDPFANGTWAWYPGAGYSWVSPYPWAWTPYHYGSWSYCPNMGWGWLPGGGGWYGLDNGPVIASVLPQSSGGGTLRPHAPPHPPAPGAPALIAVNAKPLARSEIASPTSFRFVNDSAGMGIPRETLGKLDKFSQQAVSRGSANMHIYMTMPQTNRPFGQLTASESMAASIHRGYAPAPASSRDSYDSSMSSGGNSSGSVRPTSSSAPVAAPSAPSGGARR